MLKKRFAFFLAIACIFAMFPAGAADATCVTAKSDSYGILDLDITTQMAYINYMRTDLSITDQGTAYTACIIDGYPGITTRITITMTLQKKGFLGLWWSEITSHTETYYYPYASMGRTIYSLPNGTYRVKAVYTAFSATGSETYTQYSQEVKY